MKVYTDEEIFALNAFLKKKSFFLHKTQRPCFVDLVFYIIQMPHGVDWMARKEVDGHYRKMFCLESWKRFNYGEKPLLDGQVRDYNVLPRPKPYAKQKRRAANES